MVVNGAEWDAGRYLLLHVYTAAKSIVQSNITYGIWDGWDPLNSFYFFTVQQSPKPAHMDGMK
jgi:hypothetical protein